MRNRTSAPELRASSQHRRPASSVPGCASPVVDGANLPRLKRDTAFFTAITIRRILSSKPLQILITPHRVAPKNSSCTRRSMDRRGRLSGADYPTPDSVSPHDRALRNAKLSKRWMDGASPLLHRSA